MAIDKTAYTIIRNTSGVEMFFAFIGENGTRLAAGADAKIAGDLFSMWGRSPQMVAAIKSSLEAGYVEILQTPALLVYDTGSGDVRSIRSLGGTVVAVGPEYGSYSGSAPNP